MKTTDTKPETTLAALIHLSTFSKYFIPLGNFIFPLLIWAARKQDRFIDEHGRQAINFQISVFLYMVFVAFAGLASLILIGLSMGYGEELIIHEDFILRDLARTFPFLLTLVVTGTILLGLFILELFCVIMATVRASEGAYYKYPLNIPFISASHESKMDSAATLKNQPDENE